VEELEAKLETGKAEFGSKLEATETAISELEAEEQEATSEGVSDTSSSSSSMLELLESSLLDVFLPSCD